MGNFLSRSSANPDSNRDIPDGPKREPPVVTTVDFRDIKNSLKTGDLVLLYRADTDIPNYGIIINNSENETYFPLLLVKGITKPTKKESFVRQKRYLTTVTAVVRIFYGDYKRVAVCRLKHDKTISSTLVMDLVDDLELKPYSEEELKLIEDAETSYIRSTLIAVLNLGLLYKEMRVVQEHNIDTVKDVLDKWNTTLPVEEPIFINVPLIKPGPMKKGEPPFYQAIARSVHPHKQVSKVAYNQIKDQLNTGDIVLFSTVTVGGFLIKMFGNSHFSHSALVLRPRRSKVIMIWEAALNLTGIVDLGSGEVQGGTQILPLRHKVLNGYNDEVAIRRLVDVTDEQRDVIHEKIMKLTKELEGRKYENNLFNFIKARFDFSDDYLSFLHNEEEDISSLFCSELVAHAYQEAGLLGEEKSCGEYCPDDFKTDLQLEFGKLEPEVYIELKYDD